MTDILTARVVAKAIVAQDTYAFRFAGIGQMLPACDAGAHIDVHLPSGLVRQYSLTRPAHANERYEIGVLRDPSGRGGSVEMCDKVQVGDTLQISAPRNNFALHPSHGRYVLLAGGIGITPILAMARALEERGADYLVYACARTPERAPFMDEIRNEPIAAKIQYYFDKVEDGCRLDIDALIATVNKNDHVYACGPSPFLDAAEKACAVLAPGRFHQERFKANLEPLNADQVGAFEVQLRADGPILTVPGDKSLLETLADHGYKVPKSCLEGVCGTCIVPLIASGEVIHRDTCLYPDEQQNNTSIAVCVSRGAPGSRVVIDFG